jgi:hypothetical protein
MFAVVKSPSATFRERAAELRRALHQLLFDPDDGLLAWLLMAKERLGVEPLAIDTLTRHNWQNTIEETTVN